MDRQEKEDKTKLTVEVPRSLWRAAKVRAAEEERDLREIVIDGLTLYLAAAKKKGGDRR
jgi:hypothetical protein